MRNTTCQCAGNDDEDFLQRWRLPRAYSGEHRAGGHERRSKAPGSYAQIVNWAKELVRDPGYPHPEAMLRISNLLADKMQVKKPSFRSASREKAQQKATTNVHSKAIGFLLVGEILFLSHSGQPKAAARIGGEGFFGLFGNTGPGLLPLLSICSVSFCPITGHFWSFFRPVKITATTNHGKIRWRVNIQKGGYRKRLFFRTCEEALAFVRAAGTPAKFENTNPSRLSS